MDAGGAAGGSPWRATVTLLHSLLYETGTDRRFAHLELAAPLGLVTLHPEGDGTLHGNIVTAAGVEHVVGLAFEAGGAVLVTGSPIAAAAVAWAGERDGDGGPGKVVVLDPVGLSLRAATADATSSAAATDPDGIPQLRDGPDLVAGALTAASDRPVEPVSWISCGHVGRLQDDCDESRG